MSRLARRLWKWIAATLAGLLILLAAGVGLFRIAVPLVPELRADAEAMAEEAIGWPVHIGEIDLRWAWVGPELVLTDVQLLAPGTRQPVVTAAQLDIVFGPLDIFQDGVPRPSHLRLHKPTLALERDADGKLFLSGFALPSHADARIDWRHLLELGLQHGRLTILDGELHYRDQRSGIDDWTLRLPKISLASNGEEHEFNGSFLPPGALGEQVVFHFRATGEPALPESWSWTLDLGVRELLLDWWYQQFEWAGRGQLSGALDLSASLGGKGLESMAGGGRLVLAGLGFTGRVPAMALPDEAGMHFERIALDWEIDFNGSGVALDVRELEIVQKDVRFRDGSFALRTRSSDYPLEIAAARLPLAVLARMAVLLPSPDVSGGGNKDRPPLLANVREHIEQFAPRGDLRELILGLDLDAEPVRFRLETRFEDLGIAHNEKIPGFSGLSGTLRGDESAGLLVLDSRDVRVDPGDLFRSSLPVQRLSGAFSWEAAPDGWQIDGRDIVLENPEAAVSAGMRLTLPAEGSPLIDLDATARNIDLAARSTWLPAGVMPDALVEWLDTAIIAGHVPEAKLLLQGPLENFPFADGSGVFDIRFRVEDTVVEYVPGWPRIDGLSAGVHFHGQALDIQVDRARVMDELIVEQGSARFADLREGRLQTSAGVRGDMAVAWRFLAASPLREPLDDLLNAIETAGPMQATVDLDIPLDDVGRTTVQVKAQLQEVRVHPLALPWAAESLSGELNVTERAMTSGPLHGRFTGFPFSAAIHADTSAGPEAFAPTRVTFAGSTVVEDFAEFLPPGWLAHLAGAVGWSGVLKVPGDGSGVTVEVASAFEDAESTLPAPLNDLPPLRAGIALPDDAHVDVHLSAEDLGTGRLRFVRAPSGWRFDRGRIAMGQSGTPELQDESGLFIDGEVQTLDADDWLSLGAAGEESAPPGDAPLLRRLDLTAARFLFGRVTLESQTVRAARAGAGWELSLAGPASGSIVVPATNDIRQAWNVRLEHLRLPESEETDGAPADMPDPRDLPALMLDIGDLKIGTLALGHVTGNLERTNIGYTTRALLARTENSSMTLDGRWEFVEDSHYTSIDAVFESSDLGETLQALGYSDSGVDADSAQAEVSLAWTAAPISPEPDRVEGTVSFEFRDGSLREINPGAGRLLGLLSIAALPRRLMLDFSDFFGQGLHFDTISGDFLVTGGNAYTTNVRLEGPSISALLVGRTGLVARDYDQLAIVDPGVSASIPVAGYLAAGPTVGTALLLLSQLLKAPLADITQVKYRITGGWDDPAVERVQQEKNAAK
ncbi:MAG TPA: YhdP family protein [Gammaproteobacteria bacterium]